MRLGPAQLDQFHCDGYIIVPDLFTALAAMEQVFYGQSFQLEHTLPGIDTGPYRDER